MQRGRIGVVIQDLTPDLAEALGLDIDRGALVSRVESGSPAEAAGVQAGDVIVAVGGSKVESSRDLRNSIGLVRVGEEIEIEVERERRRLRLTVRVGDVEGRRTRLGCDGGSPRARGGDAARPGAGRSGAWPHRGCHRGGGGARVPRRAQRHPARRRHRRR